MISDFELQEMLHARFCHDIASPLSAISNGVEFLRHENDMLKNRAIELISTSIEDCLERYQFYRHAYGSSPTTGDMEVDKLRDIGDGFYSHSKLAIRWDDFALKSMIPHRLGKLILNGMIICSSVMVYGGTLHIALEAPGAGRLQVSLKGVASQVKEDSELEAILTHKEVEITPRTIQYYYTARLAKECGAAIEFSCTKDSLTLLFQAGLPRAG